MTRPTRIHLAPHLNITHVAELHRHLGATLTRGEPMEIDGTQVEEIDTATLQLLVCFWRAVEEGTIACTWTGVSHALHRTARLLGLADNLHFPDRSAGLGGHSGV
jgi:ABC-type transporter Mla MlaB component